jgi:hypothetical protein
MPGARKPSPQCALDDLIDPDGGISCKAITLAPVPIGTGPDHDWVPGGTLTPDYDRDFLLGIFQRALQLAPEDVYLQTGYPLGQVAGLLQGFHFLLDGDGPHPESGETVISHLGIGFLLDASDSGLKEVLTLLGTSLKAAQRADAAQATERAKELEVAAKELSQAIATLVRLILHGVVTYADKKNAARSAAEKKKLLEQVRSSKLASGFAAWVDESWEHLIKNRRLKTKADWHRAAVASEQKAEPPRKATTQEEVRTWIVVRLVDSDGKPVQGQKYQVQLPDSSIREGSLDADGCARFDNILPGQCKVRFPDIYGKEWTPA